MSISVVLGAVILSQMVVNLTLTYWLLKSGGKLKLEAKKDETKKPAFMFGGAPSSVPRRVNP